MTDMLVNLRNVQIDLALEQQLSQKGVRVVRAVAPDRMAVIQWMRKHFSAYSAGECAVAFSRVPISCYIAVKDKKIIGCACYNATAPNFFGPTCVSEQHRGLGIGKLLLTKCLTDMHSEGFQYAIIGGVGPVKFYEKTVQAILIENEGASIYDDFFKFSLDEEE